ncbi:MAG TPA: hypothetical protein VNL14_22280 [Candidatus Acidoferrales bacterium]|nr:hypothetical protein [Candidatus Acidoferrales bacterium]
MRFLRNPLRQVPAFSLGFVLIARGLNAGEAAPPIQLRIGSILASNQATDCDPKLARMSELKVFKYRCYRLLRQDTQRAAWRADTTFDIPGGRSLKVTPQERQNNQLSLKVRLLEGEKPLLDTTVKLREGGNLLLGGPPHEGGVLILSISASAQ